MHIVVQGLKPPLLLGGIRLRLHLLTLPLHLPQMHSLHRRPLPQMLTPTAHVVVHKSSHAPLLFHVARSTVGVETQTLIAGLDRNHPLLSTLPHRPHPPHLLLHLSLLLQTG